MGHPILNFESEIQEVNMATQVIMPQLGESVVEGKVSRWLKQVGDEVKQYEPILEVETDKVTTEVTAAASGVLLAILVEEGLTVQAGTPLAYIGEAGEKVEGAAPTQVSGKAIAQPQLVPNAALKIASGPAARISPVVAKIAAEHNIDVSQVPGTGADGRVTKKDILAYVERGSRPVGEGTGVREDLPPWERPGSGDLFKPTDETISPRPVGEGAGVRAIPPRPLGEGVGVRAAPPSMFTLPGDEFVPHTTMRRSIAEHMVRSKHTSPHVTTVFELDLSRVIAHRQANKDTFERDGARLTFTAYFVAAAVIALKAHPLVNSTFTEEGVIVHRQINIGMAVSLPAPDGRTGDAEGLLVPVLKNADQISLLGIARGINDLADRARSKKLLPNEVAGSTFTLTNHGTAGSLFATPIINQPNTGILGTGVLQKRAVVVTQDGMDMIAIKPMMYMGLTFDHRVLDGASADAFMAQLKQVLESWMV